MQAKATKGISNSDRSRLLALRVVQQATELKLTPFGRSSRSRSRSRSHDRERRRDRRRSRSRSRDGKRRKDRSRSRSRSRGRDKEKRGSRSSHKSSKHRRSRPSRSRSAERAKHGHEALEDSEGKKRPPFTEDVPKPKERSPSPVGLPAAASPHDEVSHEASDDGDGSAWWDN